MVKRYNLEFDGTHVDYAERSNGEWVTHVAYDALDAERARIIKVSQDHEEMLIRMLRDRDDHAFNLLAALREIAGNGNVPPASRQFKTADYRAGYIGGYLAQAEIAKAALTPLETACEFGDALKEFEGGTGPLSPQADRGAK